MTIVLYVLYALAAGLAVVALLRPRHELLAVAVLVIVVAGVLPLLAAA